LIAGLLIARTVLHSGVGEKINSPEEQVGVIGGVHQVGQP